MEQVDTTSYNLTKRILSGIIYGGLIMGALWYGKYAFFSVFLLFQILCQFEFYQLARKNGTAPHLLLGIIAGIFFFICSWFSATGKAGIHIYFFPFLMLYLVFIQALYSKAVQPFINIAYTLLGFFYCCIPFAAINYMVFISGNGYSPWILMGYFLLLWTYDSFAYLTGSLLGKYKLFRRISPSKTWEGLAGGVIACLVASRIIAAYITDITANNWMVIALIVIVAGTYGDLCKSLLKRTIGVKNSGTIMPGHGGIIDRMDSLLFSALFVLAYLVLLHSKTAFAWLYPFSLF